jgi:hypothetical protein
MTVSLFFSVPFPKWLGHIRPRSCQRQGWSITLPCADWMHGCDYYIYVELYMCRIISPVAVLFEKKTGSPRASPSLSVFICGFLSKSATWLMQLQVLN